MGEIKSITILENEAFLRQKSILVDLEDNSLENDVAVLEQYCINNDVMAMAAVQLGIPKRIIYIKNTNLDIVNRIQSDSITREEKLKYNEARVLINPVIISREGLTEYWEACASCLDNFGKVLRPYKIEIEYYDINGIKHNDIFKGFESTVLSHEMDHLDGVLHMDIAEELLIMPKEDRKKFRQSHGYHIISKLGGFDKLIENNTKKKRLHVK